MDVAEFYQWVRETLNRGDTLDSVIPHYIKSAVREIENKRDFSQMEWWATFTLTPSDDPIISLPARVKQIRFIRYDIEETDGNRPKWVYMTQGSPRAQIARRSDNPRHYWLKGREYIVFDAQLDQKDRDFEISAYRYSDFPDEENGDGVEHWLVNAIPTGLHAKVMVAMAGFMREDDPNMIRNWRQLAIEAISDLEYDDEMAKEWNGPTEMVYWPEHIPLDKAYQDVEE